MNFSSKIVEHAVTALSGFPGIGKRSALRMVMFLIKRPKEEIDQMAEALKKLKTDLKKCKICCNVSDTEVCEICNNKSRNENLLCIVEDMQDVIAIESTAQFNGYYHVLGGLISPIDGIGPDSLSIQHLIERVTEKPVQEIIIALNATIEGDTTTFYIGRKIKPLNIAITTISKGISVGSELEYTDEITLGRSFMGRIPYEV